MTTVSHPVGTAPANQVGDAPTCEACGVVLSAPQSARGRVRKYCNAACRQRAYKATQRVTANGVSAGLGVPRAGGTQERAAGGPGLAAGPESGHVSAGQRISSPAPSWYYAKFASPGAESAGQGRKAVRYALRQLLREVTTVDRCRSCGREVRGGAVVLKVKEGVAHYANLETCGRVWLCPVCAAKIRARRGDEIAEGVGRHITQDGGAYFVTATLPHEQGDKLARSLTVLTDSWRRLTAGKAYQEEKERHGILGTIKAVEITHGRNGWHPHIHAVLLTREEVNILHLGDWYGRLDARWARALQRNGWSMGTAPYRFRLDLVNRSTASGLAAYVTKVQDGGGLGNEIARADLKSGRKSSRTPLQILADFGSDGLVDDLDLWREYEEATAGKSALRWSRGLRELLLPDVDEQTDEEIAAEDVGGDEVAALLPHIWYRLTEIPGAEAAVLGAVERDGWAGLIRVLVGYRISTDGVLTPEQWASQAPSTSS